MPAAGLVTYQGNEEIVLSVTDLVADTTAVDAVRIFALILETASVSGAL